MNRKQKKIVGNSRRSRKRGMEQLIVPGLLLVILLAGGIWFWLLPGLYLPKGGETAKVQQGGDGPDAESARTEETPGSRAESTGDADPDGIGAASSDEAGPEGAGTMSPDKTGPEGARAASSDGTGPEGARAASSDGTGSEGVSAASSDGTGSEHTDTVRPQDGAQNSADARQTQEDSGKTAENLLEEQVETYLTGMTLREKVLQLFMVTPEALTGYVSVTAAGDRTREAVLQYPAGGIIYFAGNLKEPEQVRTMLHNTRRYYEEAGYPPPFLGVDEEGGKVARIGSQPAFEMEHIPDMRTIGDSRDAAEAERTGQVIGTCLSELGFSLDFAPVADVLTNPDNQVIGRRSFGTDPELVAEFSMKTAKGLESAGIWAVLKHYPGHGATLGDSHDGYAYTDRTLEELMEAELVPFQRGVEDGIQFIMAAHISVPSVTGDTVPCTLSPYMITEVLRKKMGYEGIVVTDAMNMGAVRQQYDSAEASVLALQAGVDLILMPENFHSACEGVLEAVESGTLTEARIDESVRRILRVKLCPLSGA